jgi:hypothetical protein
LVRKPFKTRAHVVKLVDFIENRFKSHDMPLSLGLRREETSDGLLSSEDLKEGKVVTTSLTVYHAL